MSELATWDHDDPWYAFDQIGTQISLILHALRSGPDGVAIFQQNKDWFEAQMPSLSQATNRRVYLVMQQVTQIQLQQASSPKLAAHSRIETVVSRALTGVRMERLQRAPYGVSAGHDAAIWRLDLEDALWKEAYESGRICLHWLGLPVSARLLLVFFKA